MRQELENAVYERKKKGIWHGIWRRSGCCENVCGGGNSDFFSASREPSETHPIVVRIVQKNCH